MTRSEFREEIGIMSDNELYSFAKKLIIRAGAGSSKPGWKLDLLREESANRGILAFEDALQDAVVTIDAIENPDLETNVRLLNRADYMTSRELLMKIAQALSVDISGNEFEPEIILEKICLSAGIGMENLLLSAVRGDSMTGVGINEGDILLAQHVENPGSGMIAIVKLKGKTFVKRLEFAGEKVRLVSENRAYPPVEISIGRDFEILGIVKSIIKIGE